MNMWKPARNHKTEQGVDFFSSVRSIATSALVLILFVFHIQAQQATATLDTNHYRIGEWIPLHLEITVPVNAAVTWPVVNAEIGELEVLKRSDMDSTLEKDIKTYSQTLTLTVFDSGYYPVPAFSFLVDNDSVNTTPLILLISSVPLDTSALDIKPIKDPIDVPVTFKEVLPYILAGLGILLLAWLALLYWNKRKRALIPEIIPEIIIPPHEWAFEELENLRREELWQKGSVKEYYIRLTDIFRQYVELRYRQPAMESTTEEIMDRLSILSLTSSMLEKMKTTLVLSDFVKFAKARPLANEHEQSFESVLAFIHETKAAKQAKNAET